MEKNQIFPFERNRYYAGKLLTSTDFRAEQDYMNHKRWFVNSFVLGEGIVCGLSVFNLDDFSIMVESGIAIDSQGREIVIENSIIKKLSTVEGFEKLSGNRAVLCLRYQEEDVHLVYAVDKKEMGQEYENNRVREGYQLFLMDADMVTDSYRMESEFYAQSQLYSDEYYNITATMPFVVSCGKPVKLVVKIEKHAEGGKDIALDAILQIPAFSVREGIHQLEINTGNVHLETGSSFVCDYWMIAQNEESTSTNIIAKAENIRITSGGRTSISNTNFSLQVSIQAVSPKELVTREIGKISLEMRSMGPNHDYVKLAQLTLVRTDNAYIIDSIEEGRMKQYIPLPADGNLRMEYGAFYGNNVVRKKAPQQITEQSREREASIASYQQPIYATGTCEIPLGVNAKKGMVRFSSEMIHGLGIGDIYVQVGLEYIKRDAALGMEARNTIYGLASLFAEEELPVISANLGVKVMNDKGSFIAAVGLLEDTPVAVANLRWVAVKLPGGDGLDKTRAISGKSIAVDTPTVIMEPKASHYFNVRFKNMEPCSLFYSLPEVNSGEISSEGVYTAPAKDGIYEIVIACVEMPSITAYAYAVVRKKVPEKEEGANYGLSDGSKGIM